MKKWLLAGMGLLTAMQLQAQDIHFSQFYESSILRNPALTGIFDGDYKAGIIYRNQWSSISKPFTTTQASIETRIPVSDAGDFFSVGLLGYYDKAGSIDLQTTGIYPSLNFSKALEDRHQSFLSVGFTGGYIQRSFDPGKMTFNSQYQGGSYNPGNNSGEKVGNSHIENFDLGAGVSFTSNVGEDDRVTYFVAASGYHFTQPTRSFYETSDIVRLQMKWVGSAGINWHLDNNYGLQLQANYTQQGAAYYEVLVGGLLSWRQISIRDDEPPFALSLGGYYRLNDAIIPTLKVDYARFSFGFSYDITASKLRTASSGQGGFEISVFKTGLLSAPKWQNNRTKCPKPL